MNKSPLLSSPPKKQNIQTDYRMDTTSNKKYLQKKDENQKLHASQDYVNNNKDTVLMYEH
jgi:hypothetical protein